MLYIDGGLVIELRPFVYWTRVYRGWSLPLAVFLRNPSPYLRKYIKKTAGNSERLGRQAQPGFESCTSRLPILREEPLVYWWDTLIRIIRLIRTRLPFFLKELGFKNILDVNKLFSDVNENLLWLNGDMKDLNYKHYFLS